MSGLVLKHLFVVMAVISKTFKAYLWTRNLTVRSALNALLCKRVPLLSVITAFILLLSAFVYCLGDQVCTVFIHIYPQLIFIRNSYRTLCSPLVTPPTFFPMVVFTTSMWRPCGQISQMQSIKQPWKVLGIYMRDWRMGKMNFHLQTSSNPLRVVSYTSNHITENPKNM